MSYLCFFKVLRRYNMKLKIQLMIIIGWWKTVFNYLSIFKSFSLLTPSFDQYPPPKYFKHITTHFDFLADPPICNLMGGGDLAITPLQFSFIYFLILLVTAVTWIIIVYFHLIPCKMYHIKFLLSFTIMWCTSSYTLSMKRYILWCYWLKNFPIFLSFFSTLGKSSFHLDFWNYPTVYFTYYNK